MFKIIEWNAATGHSEVLAEYLDTDDYPTINVDRQAFRNAALESFITTDTDHCQYIQEEAS